MFDYKVKRLPDRLGSPTDVEFVNREMNKNKTKSKCVLLEGRVLEKCTYNIHKGHVTFPPVDLPGATFTEDILDCHNSK